MKSLFENERRAYFNIYDDWVFHYIFSRETQESKQALIAVLNVILHRKEDPIVDIQLKDPQFFGDRQEDKDSVLDIKALTDSGELIDIEVQNRKLTFFCDRAVYYGGKLVNSALEKGEDYDKIKKSVVISFVNGSLFSDTDKLHTTFRQREIEEGIQLSDRLELHFIELGKVDPDKAIESLDPVEKLAAYMRYASDETKEDYIQHLIQVGGDAIKMTEKLFRDLTEDEIAYERRERKLKYEHDHVTEIVYAKKEGALEMLVKQICIKLGKGKTAAEIAEALEEDLVYIERICATAKEYEPDYDIEAICEKFEYYRK